MGTVVPWKCAGTRAWSGVLCSVGQQQRPGYEPDKQAVEGQGTGTVGSQASSPTGPNTGAQVNRQVQTP